MIRLTVLALTLCIGVQPIQASDIESMPLELRKPLKSEMKQIEVGLRRWLKAWYSGDLQAAAEHATRLRDGHVLKQTLSDEQMQAFVASLPEGYQQLDDAYQADASALVTATEAQDHEQMATLFGRLAASCHHCHAQYASHRFKAFRE